jgi:gliding-associated putative ABC transporter substrate-binding component GldG
MRNASKGALWAAAFLALCAVSGFSLFGVSQRLYTRIDLTKEQRFTLSQTTLDLLSQLTSPVEVRVYRTQQLQAPLLDAAQGLLDTLEEYKTHSGGKLNLAVADPTDENLSKEEREALQKEAQGFGVQQGDATFQEADKIEKRRVYLGVSLSYSGRQEVLPFVSNTATLEYDLTKALKRLITGGEVTRPVLGFVIGHGEPSNLPGQLTQLFGDEREYRNITLDKPIPEDVDALVIVSAPRPAAPQLFSEAEKFYLDQFLMRGRALIVFLGTIGKFEQKDKLPNQQELPIFQTAETGLEDLLAGYGVKTTGDIVLDTKYNLTVQVGSRKANMGGITFMEPVSASHPLFLVANQFSKESAIVKGMTSLAMPQVTSFDLSGAVAKGLTVEELVKSSEVSFRRKIESGLLIAEPNQLAEPNPSDTPPGHSVLVASISGAFPSFFAGKPTPNLTPPPQPNQPPQSAPTSLPARVDAAQEGARLVVLGTGTAFFQAKSPQNLSFFQNLLDWSVSSTDMIAIRAKNAPEPMLDEITPGAQSLLKWANILGMPLLLALFGIARWQLRKKKATSAKA